MKRYYPVIVALLGVLVGAMMVMTYDKAKENRMIIKTRYGDWQKLNLILDCIDKNYVDSIDYKGVTDEAIKAALAKLDPHTIYMPPVELEEAETDLSGQFEGIGIQFNVPNDTAVVLEVIPGGPSEKIGLLPGDRILKVDTTVIAGVKFPQDSMVRRMKGPSGTKVLITVGREKEVIPFEITRAKIPTHSVDAYFMVSDTVGYIRLSKFSRTTYREFALAGVDLLSQGMKTIIVDIRDNSGGFFDQALNLSNLFLPKDAPIVYLEGRKREREEYKADGKGILKDVGLKVLIDEGSASSSEIFAGAMQDNDRGMIIGRRSFGKGMVQEPVYFSDGSGVRITVARFYTPSGRCIQKPYGEGNKEYAYDIYRRYENGEMLEADSMKVAGGGIIPDKFVPIDTTRVTPFYVGCTKKATAMRFASYYFDRHKTELQSIEDYDTLISYLDGCGLEKAFLDFARNTDALSPKSNEWAADKPYMMTQIRALVGRYSKLGDKAFYHLYLSIDDVYHCAMNL